MSTEKLVKAIISGDAIGIDTAFSATISEKIAARLDDLRVAVASNMFAKDIDLKEDLSDAQIGRINQAIGETKRHLAKELSYSQQNQKQDRIAEYKGHIAKLEGMLSSKKLNLTFGKEGVELDLSEYTLTELTEFTKTEEFLALNELSQQYLNDYIKRSEADGASSYNTMAKHVVGAAMKNHSPDKFARTKKRAKGIDLARRLKDKTNEEIEDVGEAYKGDASWVKPYNWAPKDKGTGEKYKGKYRKKTDNDTIEPKKPKKFIPPNFTPA